MIATLRSGEQRGTIRPGRDLPMLSHRPCYSMLNFAVGVPDGSDSHERLPALKASIVVAGLAVTAPDDTILDRMWVGINALDRFRATRV
jgi:hypothetical protein